MPDVPRQRRAFWLGLALAGEVLLFLGHGAFLAAQDPRPLGTLAPGRVFAALMAPLVAGGMSAEIALALLGAIAGGAAILLVAAFAAGVDGLRSQALVPPLLLAASPVFAQAAFTRGDPALLACLLLAAGYRTFTETHTHGRLPISAFFAGLAAASSRAGALALATLFLQKLVFTRKFRLPRGVAVFAFIWLGLALAVAGVVHLVLGRAGGLSAGGLSAGGLSAAAPPATTSGLLAGTARVLRAFIGAVNGLALLPFVLALVLAWKPKEIYFRLSLAAAILSAVLVAAVRVPAGDLSPALAPALPWAFLIAGEALAHASTVLQGSGLRGRTGTILGAGVIAALVLAELAPTLAKIPSALTGAIE